MRFGFFTCIFLLASSALAQMTAPLAPTPAYFRFHFSTPSNRVELKAPVRLDEFVVGGNMELSLRSYLELVMANNTDVTIQRVTVETQQNAILRAFGVFDPTLTASFNSQRAKSQPSDILAGASTLNQLTQPASFAYNQRLQTGTQFNVGFTASKTSTNNSFTYYNPSINSGLSFGFTQPLLRNRGTYVTKLPITIARSRLRQSEYTLEDQIIRLLVTAENAYWQVILERENLKVQEKGLENLGKQLKRNQRELELGAISPLDIYNPQAQYEQQRIQVTQAKFRLIQAEDALRRQLGADLDPRFRTLPLVLSESPYAQADSSTIDRENLVEKALKRRPDLRSQIQSLDIDDLQIQQNTNALRPDLSLTGSYSATGRGGTYYPRAVTIPGGGSSEAALLPLPGGLGDALNQTFGFSYPTYAFGLRLTLPIRDRAAKANLADGLVNKRLDALRARSLEQTVRLDVLNAVTQVESSIASIEIAKVGLDLAQKLLDAEQKKYDLGTTTIFFVLDAETKLVNAQATVVNQSVQYKRNMLTLYQRTGELLDTRGIVVK
jgi:outer membrane protein TolC